MASARSARQAARQAYRRGFAWWSWARGGLAAMAGAALLTACAGREGETPESAVRSLVQMTRTGDRAMVYQLLGPHTRAHIESMLTAGRSRGVSPFLRPEDLVTVGWVPPAWEASSVHEIRRGGDEAEVEVSSVAGDHQVVSLVREGPRWKIELPVR